MRVLIVEPQQDFGRLMSDSLAWENAVCDHAINAQEAIHLADQNLPDVVILELNLAGHNGLEFLYELRSHTDWKDVPVVIYSHVSPQEAGLDKATKKRLGITDYLYKPLTSFKKLNQVARGAVFESAGR